MTNDNDKPVDNPNPEDNESALNDNNRHDLKRRDFIQKMLGMLGICMTGGTVFGSEVISENTHKISGAMIPKSLRPSKSLEGPDGEDGCPTEYESCWGTHDACIGSYEKCKEKYYNDTFCAEAHSSDCPNLYCNSVYCVSKYELWHEYSICVTLFCHAGYSTGPWYCNQIYCTTDFDNYDGDWCKAINCIQGWL